MKYEVRVRLEAYVDVKVEAEDEEQAGDFALDLRTRKSVTPKWTTWREWS